MLKHVGFVWAAVLIIGCPAETPPPSPDAASSAHGFGATCTTVTDTASTECDSMVCTDAFDMIGHPVCSQKCPPGDGTTCPAGADGMKKCNMKGYCKP